MTRNDLVAAYWRGVLDGGEVPTFVTKAIAHGLVQDVEQMDDDADEMETIEWERINGYDAMS